jgi:hypothetical protein
MWYNVAQCIPPRHTNRASQATIIFGVQKIISDAKRELDFIDWA